MSQNSNNSATMTIPVAEQFWALVDKADRRFSRVRDLPIFGRNRNDLEFHKAFKIYTQLWKMQQENRTRLIEAGMRRWEVGEIASRIAQLYYGQYQRTADSACLAEAFVFYEAILDRDYFRDTSSSNSGGQEMVMLNKQLRFLARFVTVCLMIGKKDMVLKLSSQLKSLIDDSKKSFQEAEYKEWKHVIQEISRFMKADTPFMNKRPLRYNYLFDTPPNNLNKSKRALLLKDSILSTHYPNEVKFTELGIDAYRMLQSLEWDPSGSFAQQNDFNNNINNNNNESGAHKSNLSLDLKDPSLPPNPYKTILYRPSVSHFLTVLATKCEELPSDGIILIYLSASGDYGVSSENYEKLSGNFKNMEINNNNPSENKEPRLWLGYRANEGSSYIYPCDLIPFTRRPLFLIIDSPEAHAFKRINGEEKGETAMMLLSPAWRYTATSAAVDPTRKPHNNGNQFTMFLTSPLQAFWFLVAISASDFNMEKYNEAEKLVSELFSEFEASLLSSSTLDPIWLEALGDPFLRRFLLRFIFCRAALVLFKPTSENDEFAPTCYPFLPECVNPESAICISAIRRLASFLEVSDRFNL